MEEESQLIVMFIEVMDMSLGISFYPKTKTKKERNFHQLLDTQERPHPSR